MSTIPACPQCVMENTYQDGDNYICADCGHEWPIVKAARADDNAEPEVKDSNGNVLKNGDSVALIKVLPGGKARENFFHASRCGSRCPI